MVYKIEENKVKYSALHSLLGSVKGEDTQGIYAAANRLIKEMEEKADVNVVKKVKAVRVGENVLTLPQWKK